MKPLLGDVLLAGTGGFLGAAVRLMSCVALSAWGGQWGYAWGTFVVNIVGSFCMGYVSPFWLSVQHPARVFVLVGVLGGFTTFSSFSADTLRMLQDGRSGAAALYVGASVLLGLAAAWGGFVLHGWMLK